ncbi:hypothetical protein TNCV_2243611 [Trichonephila clavipes]|nr:hypothetical protein TNCV_2243611 [Trichonephila clavipes]
MPAVNQKSQDIVTDCSNDITSMDKSANSFRMGDVWETIIILRQKKNAKKLVNQNPKSRNLIKITENNHRVICQKGSHLCSLLHKLLS